MPDEKAQDYIQSMREKLMEYMSKTGISQRRTAKELNVSESTVSLFLNGSYQGNNQELAKSIEQYLSLGAARESLAKRPETCLKVSNLVDIERRARAAHLYGNIVLLYGPAGCGKTTALQHYTRANNGVVYVEADVTINSPRCILKLILNALGEDAKGSTADIMQCILAKLTNTKRLLIIDEAQHLTEKSFDAVRAINDKAHIGIVYAGNPSILKRMYGRQAEEFDQVYSRIVYKCKLSNGFSMEDISNIYCRI